MIPGEEVKTDGQGEVIGLFLTEETPRGMSFGDTIAAIREQGGLVYVPARSTGCTRSPSPSDPPWPRSTCSKVHNARLLFRGLQRRGGAEIDEKKGNRHWGGLQ